MTCRCEHPQLVAEDGTRRCIACGHDLPDRLCQLAAVLAPLVAPLVAEQLSASPAPERLIDAKAAAEMLNLDVTTVRRHADELGVKRIGSGPRPRLRFDPERLRRAQI